MHKLSQEVHKFGFDIVFAQLKKHLVRLAEMEVCSFILIFIINNVAFKICNGKACIDKEKYLVCHENREFIPILIKYLVYFRVLL